MTQVRIHSLFRRRADDATTEQRDAELAEQAEQLAEEVMPERNSPWEQDRAELAFTEHY